jgi:replicative DNA helicase
MSVPAKFVTAGAVARSPALDLDAKPERWTPGPPFDSLDLRPGRVILLGAPPGAGKTTLTQQVVCDVLVHQPQLRAVVGNVEMSPAALVEKLLARLARVPLDALQDRELTPDQRRRVDAAAAEHAGLLDRIAFIEAPYTLPHLGAAMLQFGARLCVVDYCQRFTAGDDDRVMLDRLMSGVRTLAKAGACVVLVSSVARQKSKTGSSTYAGLSLAAFRGSAELEFGADRAYLLHAGKDGVAALECVKARFGRMQDIPLQFDGPHQMFTPGDLLDQFDAATGGTGDR